MNGLKLALIIRVYAEHQRLYCRDFIHLPEDIFIFIMQRLAKNCPDSANSAALIMND
jgi:hypothetical protein